MNTEIRRGEEAKRLLSEPLFVEAFTAVEQALISRMRTVDVGAHEAQRDLIVSLQLLGKVKQYIEQVAVSGRLAQMSEEAVQKARGARRGSVVAPR